MNEKTNTWQYFWGNDNEIGTLNKGVGNDAISFMCKGKVILLLCSGINDDGRLFLKF